MANLFEIQFKILKVTIVSNERYYTVGIYSFRQFEDNELKRVILSLKTKNSLGVDKIPINLIQECANELVSYLIKLLNNSMLTGI